MAGAHAEGVGKALLDELLRIRLARGFRGSPLGVKNGQLALDPPSVAAGFTVAAHHAVTRNEHGDAVPGAGLGDGARGRWPADALGQLLVTAALTAGDATKLRPDTLLKRGAHNVERQVGSWFRTGEHAFDLMGHARQTRHVTRDWRAWEGGPQLVPKHIRIVAQRDITDTALCGGNEQGTEGRVEGADADKV